MHKSGYTSKTLFEGLQKGGSSLAAYGLLQTAAHEVSSKLGQKTHMADAQSDDRSAASKLAVLDVARLRLFDDLIVQCVECALDRSKHLIARSLLGRPKDGCLPASN